MTGSKKKTAAKKRPAKKKTTKKKAPTKKKQGARRTKRGPKTAEEHLEATDAELVTQMRRTSLAVYRRIEKLAESGKDIPMRLLGAARMCGEWHTDYMTVKSAMPDLDGDVHGEQGG